MRHPSPTRGSALFLYQIRGNRNFTLIGDTHRIDAMTRCPRARVYPCKDRICEGEPRLDGRTRGYLSQHCQRGPFARSIDIARRPILSAVSHHPRRVSFFLSFFLSFSSSLSFFFYFLHPCCGFDTFLIRCSITPPLSISIVYITISIVY